MNISSALMLFFVLTFIYILIIEVFTILFRLTGLTYDKSNFQVISMLTNSGFTTQDSEAITSSRIRRKIAKLTIIFGYLFTVVIMSSVVNIFLSLSNSELQDMWISGIIICVSIGLLLLLKRFRVLQKFIDRKIAKIGKKMMFGKNSNPIILLDIYENNVMAEISLEKMPETLINTKIKDSRLKEKYKIQLILIKRSGVTKSIINADDCLQKDDIIVVFGDYKNIKLLFNS